MNWPQVVGVIYAIGFAVALAWALIVRARATSGKSGLPIAALLVLLAWPLLVIGLALIAISELISQQKKRRQAKEEKRKLEELLDRSIADAKAASELIPEDVEVCCRGLTEFKADGFKTIVAYKLATSLTAFWQEGADPFDPGIDREDRPFAIAPRTERLKSDISGGPLGARDYSLAPSPAVWLFGMSRDFQKAITGIDRKLQGRVLEALTEISTAPTTVRGDTMKPLSHELSGLWRYRLGDYRLVYQPLPEKRQILLVNLASRGSVYG